LLHVAIKVNFAYWAVTSLKTSATSQGVTAVRLAELMIMYPLCLATTCAIMRQSPIRFWLELVTSLLQLLGMFIFLATEFPHATLIQGKDDYLVDGDGTMIRHSLFECLISWFGYWVCTMVWSLVPLHRACRAFTQCLHTPHSWR
jgi:EXPERA (EXPanded EBP superfamily)